MWFPRGAHSFFVNSLEKMKNGGQKIQTGKMYVTLIDCGIFWTK
jgi:hypothetical protein